MNAPDDYSARDLLSRPEVNFDHRSAKSFIEGRSVLVTGAGGSIGSRIVDALVKYCPENIVLLGRGEGSIFESASQMDGRSQPYETVIANVRDKRKINSVFRAFRPDVVIHTAAHKHVPLMEENPDEAVLNNVMGTKNVVDAATNAGAERLVNLSTDKAVAPVSVMGATKQVAERIVARVETENGQNFCSVRFGNVLGTRGSVVPIFEDQIDEGGPVTVTHPEMERYFMTPHEAAYFSISAVLSMGSGETHIMDMGMPLKIECLARKLIRQRGLAPEKDISICYTNPRPGEKITERLVSKREIRQDSVIENATTVSWKEEIEQLEPKLELLIKAAANQKKGRVRDLLGNLTASGQTPISRTVKAVST